MEIALTSPDKKSWRAAWMVDKIHDQNPELVLPYIPALIEKLIDLKDMGKKRHFLKLIGMHEIPVESSGFLADYCLTTLSSSEPPAVRVHAMQVLFNISEMEKDFKPELLDTIEQEMEFRPTPGILTRGAKLAKKLRCQILKSNSAKGR
jgi:hypothetical protein